jgi:hypothetical protein
MKFIVLCALYLSLMSHQILAEDVSLSCLWQESSDHAPQFYREAVFAFDLTKSELIVTQDTFLNRRYTPCWIGNYSSCSFGFDYDRRSDWTILSASSTKISLEAPGFYWNAELNLEFSKDLQMINSGDQISMVMSGDDGDGVMFHDELFTCQVK